MSQPRARFGDNRFLQIVLVCYALFWVVLAIHPVDRSDWFLENLLVFATASVLIPTYRKFQLSNLSYVLILLFLALHAIGAHYTYGKVPIGFVNWSPHSDVDPQPFIEAGYYTEHHKFIAGATHVDFRNEAILGYAYDFNETWRVQVDWQSGSGNSSTIGFTWNITRDFQVNPAIYVTNDSPHEVLGYVVFTYTFHLWGGKEKNSTASPK